MWRPKVFKVLVIEDDDAVRKVVCRILRSVGHEPIEAGDGLAGMAALHREQPDLVITDILMPRQEGIETISQIRDVSGVPIIAISGTQASDTFAPLVDAQMMGADITLKKPFSVEALLAAVDELLRGDAGGAGFSGGRSS